MKYLHHIKLDGAKVDLYRHLMLMENVFLIHKGEKHFMEYIQLAV